MRTNYVREEIMPELQICAVVPKEKGRIMIRFDNGTEVLLYRGELRRLPGQESTLLLTEGGYIPEGLYQKVLTEIVGIRAKKRAMFLLERMDRTEQQLSDKLKQNGYPTECVEDAIAYVKKYHYIDDLRYARTYVRYHQQKKSRQRLRTDLMQKGVAKDTIELALEEEFASDEREKIRTLMEKRHYDYGTSDRREQQRMYQFLLRRGYRSNDILAVMKAGEIWSD